MKIIPKYVNKKLGKSKSLTRLLCLLEQKQILTLIRKIYRAFIGRNQSGPVGYFYRFQRLVMEWSACAKLRRKRKKKEKKTIPFLVLRRCRLD